MDGLLFFLKEASNYEEKLQICLCCNGGRLQRAAGIDLVAPSWRALRVHPGIANGAGDCATSPYLQTCNVMHQGPVRSAAAVAAGETPRPSLR